MERGGSYIQLYVIKPGSLSEDAIVLLSIVMCCNRIEPCIESGRGVKNERALMVDIAMDSEAYARK